MANKRGQLNCAKDAKNVGFGSCFEDWKLIKGALYYDNARSFTDAELEDLQSLLQAEAAKDVKSARMFPIHGFVAATDNTEDVVLQTFDYGAKSIVRDGDNDWSFQFVDGGNCLSSALRTHNGRGHVLFYDKEYKILGTKRNGLFSTIPLQFMHTKAWGLATGSTTATYMIRFVFESKYVNELRDFVKAEFDPAEILGLQDIEIVQNSFNATTGLLNATLQTRCGAVNLFDEYSTDFDESLISGSDQDGNDVAVSNVTPVAGTKSFNIQLDPTDFPDGGTVTLTGALHSVLAAAGITGYEITNLELEIPGS